MIDLHTHILPDWDDGAADQASAEKMLQLACDDGISQIALTPHVYGASKRGDNIKGLKGRIRNFVKQSKAWNVRLYGGAEVHVHPDMIQHIIDLRLTINGTNFVYIEFPAEHVPEGAPNLVYRMMLEGLIPIISHPERNLMFARAPEMLYELVRQGALAQVTSKSITGGFGREARKAAEAFLRHRLVQLIASDAHDTNGRPPQLAAAVEAAGKIVGAATAEAMVTRVPAAILKNEQIPDLGEPACPDKRNKLRFFFR